MLEVSSWILETVSPRTYRSEFNKNQNRKFYSFIYKNSYSILGCLLTLNFYK